MMSPVQPTFRPSSFDIVLCSSFGINSTQLKGGHGQRYLQVNSALMKVACHD